MQEHSRRVVASGPTSRRAVASDAMFEVDELGCGQRFACESLSRPLAVGTVIDERERQSAGVNDDHGRPG